MNTLTCRFEPLDTWFFREARPHGSVGSSELGSVFPPPVNTLLGALRTLIGDAWHSRHGTNWRQFAQLDELKALIGHGDDLGALGISGPFLSLEGQRLYPAPANLMVKDGHYFLLDLGKPVNCDLGKVCLPCFPKQVEGLSELAGSKPTTHCWLTHDGWQAILKGRAPDSEHVLSRTQLLHEESRLGIARDNSRHAVQEGLLYQTRHLRLTSGLGIELELHGLADASLLPSSHIIRLGGEGRQAALHVEQSQSKQTLQPLLPTAGSTFSLYHLTPAPCTEALPAGIPDGFRPVRQGEHDVWEGELGGIPMRVLAVACTRPLREGGWDMANHQARPVQSLLAPGSVLYVQALAPLPSAQIFSQLADPRGRGLLMAGLLPLSSTFQG